MGGIELNVGPGALLFSAFLYFIGGGAALAAFYTAALAHELGHLLALCLSGTSVRRLRLTAAGPVLEYDGALSPGWEALVVAAGPIAGIVFAVGCFAAETPYFRYAGLVALLSSAFNLLPACPMDGGRLARLFLESSGPPEAALRLMRVLGSLTALAVGTLGVLWRAPVIVAAGIFLLANAVKLR